MERKRVSCAWVVFFLGVIMLCNCTTAKVKEKKSTARYNGTNIEITIYGEAEVTKVKPEIKMKKGEKKGTLNVTVELKNTGTKPDRYNVFASGVFKEGVAEGGNLEIPGKGLLEPGEKTEGKIKTRFKAKELPSKIILEVYSLEDLGHKADVLESLAPQ